MATFSGRSLLPMKAVPGELPDDDGDWAYEIKWDGMRVIAFLDQDGVRLASSNGKNATAAFPELSGLTELLTGFDSMILDGEVVAMGDDGLPSFSELQHRMHVTDSATARAKATETPIIFAIFDLLHLNGHDTVDLMLADRRRLLEQIVDEPGTHWRLTDQSLDNPTDMLKYIIAKGMEGLIAKRLASTYQPGKRSKAWVKIKPTQRQEFVVGGWVEGRGAHAGGIGSLLLGVMESGGGDSRDDSGDDAGDGGEANNVDGSRLVPCGRVGSGLDEQARRWWMAQLTAEAAAHSPFCAPVVGHRRELHWCKPRHVIEVGFGEWTNDGRLRQPVYLGLRNDKDPTEVFREIVLLRR